MSLLEKLHRDDQARTLRPEVELSRLGQKDKDKGEEREREEEETEDAQLDATAAHKLAKVALDNPVQTAARAITNGADPIAPIAPVAPKLDADNATQVAGPKLDLNFGGGALGLDAGITGMPALKLDTKLDADMKLDTNTKLDANTNTNTNTKLDAKPDQISDEQLAKGTQPSVGNQGKDGTQGKDGNEGNALQPEVAPAAPTTTTAVDATPPVAAPQIAPAEPALGGDKESTPATTAAPALAVLDGGAAAPDAQGPQAKGAPVAKPTPGGAPPIADEVAPQLDAAPDAAITKTPVDKLGPGGAKLAANLSKAPKNVVGRWADNLDSLDIGPDPEMPVALDGPGASEPSMGEASAEVGVPGVTMPKLAPKGPRPKIHGKKGRGDWSKVQDKHLQTTTNTVQARRDQAAQTAEETSTAAGGMMKSSLDRDVSTASSLTASANRAPQLVQKRGGKIAGRKAAPKQELQAPAAKTSPALDKANAPAAQAKKIDDAADLATSQLDQAIAPVVEQPFKQALDGAMPDQATVKAVADPKTRALAAVAKVPADQKSSVLGRLDAVAGAPPAQVQTFFDRSKQTATQAGADHVQEADKVTTDHAGKAAFGAPPVAIDVKAMRGTGDPGVAQNVVAMQANDATTLRQIQEEAFADLPINPQQPVKFELDADRASPQAQPQQATDGGGATQPAPHDQAKDPQQTVARAQGKIQQASGANAARAQQHTHHARNREDEAKQRATGRKKQADADKKQREAALEKEAPAQKAKMKAELTAHKDLAVQALTMNKEQLAAEYERRLTEDVKALQQEIEKQKGEVKESWEGQKPKVEEAYTKAVVDIDKFCNAELKTIDGQKKTLEQQLKGNKEQAAKTAEEQGKDDCDRYADTRDGNIERIKSSAKDAADEQGRLGAEAYRIGLARADRAADDAAKATAKQDAEAQKTHFDNQAKKCLSDGEAKAATEKKKYDDLIAKRTLSYQTTAKNIREKGVGYLDELAKSFEQAKVDIEKLRLDSKAEALKNKTYDLDIIGKEIEAEMTRLGILLEERELNLRTEIKYALASMANLTDDEKAKMRADIEKACADACARIDEAKANELGAMQLQLADCHAQIDQSLGKIGSHTAKAVRQLASLKQEFSEQVNQTSQTLKDRGEQAVRTQQQIASTVQTTASKVRSGAMDSVSGQSQEELGKRDVWTDLNAQKASYDKKVADDIKNQAERANDLATKGKQNHAVATERKLTDARRKMGEAVGGWGVNPDMGVVMQEMAKLSPEEIEQIFKGPEGEKLKARFDYLQKGMGSVSPGDLKRIEEMGKAGTPEQVKAQVIDWSFNGGFTGIGYDDKTFKAVMSGMSKEERAEIDRAFKEKTGRTIDAEIDDEAWGSQQNNRLMKANNKSDAAAIAEEKWQAAEGGFFRGVKDFVDAVPGGRILTDPAGSLARGVGPMFGFKAPDHPLDTLAGHGMNQDAYIAQTDKLRTLTEPPPGASPAEVSAYLTKRREMMREIDGWLGANHNGLSLEQMDNSEANSDYNRFWMKNNDATTFRNMLDAGRTGDWAKYSDNKAAYSVETTLGNRNWLKQEIEHRQGRGDLKGLREFLATRSPDGKFETFIDANISQPMDRGYFKSIAQDPAPQKGTKEWKQLMANRLLYAQFGGRTGWGDDRAELEKVIGGLSKEELAGVKAEYSALSGQYGLTMDNDMNKAQMATNPVGFFFLGNWSAGNLDNDMYLSYGGYMSDATGGLIGKGRDYAMVEYDLQHGKPQTMEELMARERFKRDFDTSSGMFNVLREKGIYDSRGYAGEFADKSFQELEQRYEELKAKGIANISLNDPRIAMLPPEQIALLAQFYQIQSESEAWAKSGNANTRAIVDGMTTIVTTTVTIITTAAITIVTAGTATPFLVAALTAAGGAAMAGLAGMGVKIVMLGNAYGGNEAKVDLASTVIDALVAGVTAGQGIANFANKIVGKLGVSQKLAQEVLKELLTNAIQAGADMTKFLLDESLYQGSPEEVLAKIRKRAMQLTASTVLSTGAGVTKYNGAALQTTIQSAVSYDPDQPAWGQFLNYASSMAAAVGTEAATKWGTGVSEKHFGSGGAFGPTKDSPHATPGSSTVTPTAEAPVPANGMRTRSDGVIEVTSPEIAAAVRQQVAEGKATKLDDHRYLIDTPSGKQAVELHHEGGPSVKPVKPDAVAPTEDTTVKPVKSTSGDEATPPESSTPKKAPTPEELQATQRKAIEEHLVEKRKQQLLEQNPKLDPQTAERRARLDFEAFGETVGSERGVQRDKSERDKSQGDAGHGQIEVHSHFMGNVEPDVILKRLVEAGGANGKVETLAKPDPNGATPGDRVGDVSPYEPLLREIAKLRNEQTRQGEATLAHTYKEATPEQRMAGQKYAIDPETNQPIIEKRGTAGDALNHVETVLARIDGYKEMLLDPTLSRADREYIRSCINEEATSGVNKALRASNETDFNSAYEVRDELIKKFYGDGDRAKILGDAAGKPFDQQLDHYREHFAERPAVQDKLTAYQQLEAQLKNAPESMPKEELAALKKKLAETRKSIEEQVAYDAYAKDTILRLAQDDIRYTEQSNSLKKMKERFDPEQVEMLKRQLAAEHPELAAKIWAIEIKHMAMITTNNFGTRDGDPTDLKKVATSRPSDADFLKSVDDLVKMVRRGDTAGVDIAGAELFKFDGQGRDRMKYLFDKLMDAAKESGQKIVLRPHVGEGANDTETGKHFGRDNDRQVNEKGELTGPARARHNVEQMIETFEQIAKLYGGTSLPPEIVVRFGHATHTTPEMAAKMAKLGIIAEVNLASNVQTGASPQTQPTGGKDAKRGKQEVLDPHDASQRGHGNMDEHALGSLVAAGVPIILSTDAHAVMSTDMKDQYDRAAKIVRDIIANERLVEVMVGDPPNQTKQLLTYQEMDPTMKARFDRAQEQFYKDANSYHDERRGGSKFDPDKGEGGSQLTTEGQVERLKRLHRDAQSSDEGVKNRANAELERFAKDPEWIFASAKVLQDSKSSNGAMQQLSGDITGLLQAQRDARRGKNVELQSKRENFERLIALEVLKSGSEVNTQITSELDVMCKKALDYINHMKAADTTKALESLGTPVEKGYGGGLSDGKNDAAKILAVLESGNIRERMLALGQFTEMLAKDVIRNRKAIEDLAKQGGAGAFTGEDAQRLAERAKAYEGDQRDASKRNAKDFLKPLSNEKEGNHQLYAEAKAQDMDTKLPPLVAAKVSEFLGMEGPHLDGAMAPKGEDSPLARTGAMTVREAIEKGLNLSKREIEAAGGLDKPLNWVVGQVANIVDPNAKFIADAREQSMPLKAGISGTTFRWMQTVELLGGNPQLGRLAAVGSLQGADAHSWHEIAYASQGYGTGEMAYDPNNPYAGLVANPEKTGLTPKRLAELAAEAGVTLDQLQGIAPLDDTTVN